MLAALYALMAIPFRSYAQPLLVLAAIPFGIVGAIGGHILLGFGLSIISHTEPMDIGIYANPDYYFQYDNSEFQALITKLNSTTDPEMRNELLGEAQKIISGDYVNGYLFQLASLSVAKAGVQGLWSNAPTQATDLTAVSWAE